MNVRYHIAIMKIASLIIFVLLFTHTFSQKKSEDTEIDSIIICGNSNDVYSILESMPKYPFGRDSLDKYLSNNHCEIDGNFFEGIIYVSVIIDEKGNVTNPTVQNSYGDDCDLEALSVINNFPQWIAGSERGQNLKCSMFIAVKFGN